jgi:hypothetical protein
MFAAMQMPFDCLKVDDMGRRVNNNQAECVNNHAANWQQGITPRRLQLPATHITCCACNSATAAHAPVVAAYPSVQPAVTPDSMLLWLCCTPVALCYSYYCAEQLAKVQKRRANGCFFHIDMYSRNIKCGKLPDGMSTCS